MAANAIKIKDTKADKIFVGFVYLFLALALVIVLYPLIYIVGASISEPQFVNSERCGYCQKGLRLKGIRRFFKMKIFGAVIVIRFFTLL